MIIFYIYFSSLVTSWILTNFFIDEDYTNADVYFLKFTCSIPVINSIVIVLCVVYLLDKEKQIFNRLVKHFADKPFKRKTK